MTLEEFITKWTGKKVDFDGVYPNQCMDLMHQYVYEVLEIKDKSVLAHPSAYQVYSQFSESQLFERIENTPVNVPQKGDIVVFNQKVGPDGHVSIFVSGNANTFKSFDANWPSPSLPHLQDHTYVTAGQEIVSGWLRFKSQEATVAVPVSVYPDIIHGSSQWDAACNDQGLGDPKHTDYDKLKSVIAGYKSRITDLQNQLTTAQTEVSNKDEQVGRLKEQVLNEQSLRMELNNKLNDTLKKYSDITSSYEGRIKELQGQVDQLAEDKGKLNQQIAELKQSSDNVTAFGHLRLFIKKLFQST